MSDADGPFIEPSPIVKPAASIDVVKESFDPPSASVEPTKASGGAVTNPAPKPTGPSPSVDTEKKGIDKGTVTNG